METTIELRSEIDEQTKALKYTIEKAVNNYYEKTGLMVTDIKIKMGDILTDIYLTLNR